MSQDNFGLVYTYKSSLQKDTDKNVKHGLQWADLNRGNSYGKTSISEYIQGYALPGITEQVVNSQIDLNHDDVISTEEHLSALQLFDKLDGSIQSDVVRNFCSPQDPAKILNEFLLNLSQLLKS